MAAPKYPFQPDILDAMPEVLAERYRELELFLLREITSRLKSAGELNEVTVQDIRALRAHGITLEEIQEAIAKKTNLAEKDLSALLDDVVSRNQRYYKEIIGLAKVTAPETIVDAATIAAIKKQTLGECVNLTQSMGFLVDGGRTRLTPAAAYQWALDSAALQVESGAASYNHAVAQAARQLVDSGVCVCFDGKGQLIRGKVVYESGHKDQIDVAVRRAVMTGVSQICDQYTDQAATVLGTHYFEVSAHAGARDIPKPHDWSAHKSWQGRIYYESKHGEKDPAGKYKDLKKTTGFGMVDGLCGANCRHRRFLFVPGVMEPTYTEEELKTIDKPDFEYQKIKYTTYEATQKQREIERAIRANKRKLSNAMLSDDEKTALKTRQKRLYEEYEKFSKAAGLRQQRERANVYVR